METFDHDPAGRPEHLTDGAAADAHNHQDQDDRPTRWRAHDDAGDDSARTQPGMYDGHDREDLAATADGQPHPGDEFVMDQERLERDDPADGQEPAESPDGGGVPDPDNRVSQGGRDGAEAAPARRRASGRSGGRSSPARAGAQPRGAAGGSAALPQRGGGPASGQLVINYVPGEECRVAVVINDRLEELHAERTESASHVGNIYVGRVVNVEPSIQAAFIDFGLEANGFLHTSDLHPRYFPGEDGDTTERVGKKTPRRERPPIQECLRRGQEIAVQVLKEGVGSKGPTLTSYLSVPGRFLVMMPLMDKVGVSRKVEDEDLRRKMREILDQLELPDGFGFILRTAGMDRTKAELKRDLAYLLRLWKDIDRRWKSGHKPRLLYSESDLLVRALRDILTADIDRIVIDNESALNRAARFLKIVAPRSTAKLVRYTGKTPIFHALGLEKQIQLIHAREVPLPSGGRLVIDETEALVAIDVNSGKMRSARDAETTAYRTNLEACDEICRQLRLRDLGGVIVNDLIDMRFVKHRREVEQRFRDNLKRDRARWTTAPISEFGILEMTRQRMRGSHESVHFGDCPVCRGRGLVQRPDSVAADALRELAAILDHDKAARVEMVVGPRLAGELLSARRRALSRLERDLNKRVDVRVSEAVPIDRVGFYAYDERGNDIDTGAIRYRAARADELIPYQVEKDAPADPDEGWSDREQPERDDEPEIVVDVVEQPPHPIEIDDADLAADAPGGQRPANHDSERGGRRRRRRGGRGRGSGRDPQHATAGGRSGDRPSLNDTHPSEDDTAHDDQDGPSGQAQPSPEAPRGGADEGPSIGESVGRRRRRRRGGRGRRRGGASDASAPNQHIGNRGGAPMPGIPGYAGAPEPDAHDADAPHTRGEPEDAPDFTAVSNADTGDEPSRDHRLNGQPSDGENGLNPDETGGRRRRRRGRRGGRGGRGRRGGSGGAPADPAHADDRPADAPAFDDNLEVPADGAPADSEQGVGAEGDRRSRGGRRRRGKRGGRGGRGNGANPENTGREPDGRSKFSAPPPREAARPAAPPTPAPAPKSDQQPKRPRSLYATRRRLGPGEIKGIGGGDE